MKNHLIFFGFILSFYSCGLINLEEKEAIEICKQSTIQFKLDDIASTMSFASLGLDIGSTWGDFANALAGESPNTKYSWKANKVNIEEGIFIVSFEDENGWGHRWEVSLEQKIVKHINTSEFLRRKYFTSRLSDSEEFVIVNEKVDTIRIIRRNRYIEPEIVYDFQGTIINNSGRAISSAKIYGELKLIFEEKTISGSSSSSNGFLNAPSKSNLWKPGEEKEFRIRTRGIEIIYSEYLPPYTFFEVNLIAEDPVGYKFNRNIKEDDISEKWVQFMESINSPNSSTQSTRPLANSSSTESENIKLQENNQSTQGEAQPRVDPRAMFPGSNNPSNDN